MLSHQTQQVVKRLSCFDEFYVQYCVMTMKRSSRWQLRFVLCFFPSSTKKTLYLKLKDVEISLNLKPISLYIYMYTYILIFYISRDMCRHRYLYRFCISTGFQHIQPQFWPTQMPPLSQADFPRRPRVPESLKMDRNHPTTL